jgi:hypothetical protein
MKRTITTLLITTALASGAFAQSSLTSVLNTFSNDGITTAGPAATDPNNASTWYYGTVNISLYYAPLASVSADQIADINSVDGTLVGCEAIGTLIQDGFTLVSATTLGGSTAGSLSYNVSEGYFADGPDQISLLAPVPDGGSGWLAMYAVAVGGDNDGNSGVLAWEQDGFGGDIDTDPTGLNLVMVPEPATMALATLGGASLFLFRRRK